MHKVQTNHSIGNPLEKVNWNSIIRINYRFNLVNRGGKMNGLYGYASTPNNN